MFFFAVLWAGTGLFGQEMSVNMGLIKTLIPNSSRVAVIFNPNGPAASSLTGEMEATSRDQSLMVIKVPITSIREIAPAMRNLASFEVDFMYLVEDKIITGTNSIKFVVKSTVKKGIPVFATTDNAFKGGALGRIDGSGDAAVLTINGKVQSRFNLQIPEGNNKIKIEE
ncbi:ABC transporter substrate binding protein [Acanthopleuribacter pedis]|uniref:Uncharacterized protein n=1 Tax=Acanthopleuribacter pedis TaxID=442870 RepID=A0A8J7Q636_9BACT|nr:ABC transporter substrate binding protein [Acanthopleuribacter pedis]MBO1321172.1 hypothetical protein [Acanthopleuribacter pedis]